MLVAEPDHLGDFVGAAGANHGAGASDQQAAPIRHERLLAVVVLDQALRAHDRPQAIAHLGGERNGWNDGFGRRTGSLHLFPLAHLGVHCAANVRRGIVHVCAGESNVSSGILRIFAAEYRQSLRSHLSDINDAFSI